MSVEAVGWALKQTLSPPEKLVLVLLADHHNRATGLCIPSQSSIGEQTCMSVRTVQRHLKSLENRELIIRTARFRSQGRGRTSDAYILQGDNLTPMVVQGDKSRRTKATNQDDQHDSVVVPVTGREPEGNQVKKKTSAMTEAWEPESDNRNRIATKHPSINLERELDNFRDHYISKGERRADWNASLRTWVRNAEKWAKPKGQPEPKPGFPAGAGGIYT